MKIINFIKDEVRKTKVLLDSVPTILVVLFVISLVMMNLLANKSIDLNVSWLALDAGIIISWMLFLTLDVIVKRFGSKASTRLTVVAVLINLLVSVVFFAASKIPGTWSQAYVPEGDVVNSALDSTIAGTWYVLVGSTVAFIASSIVNALVNVAIGKLFKKNASSAIEFFARSYVSTVIAQVTDNLIFAFMVSYVFFGWTVLQCIMCSLTGAVVEFICEAAFSPFGYKISKKWEEQGIGNDYLSLEDK